MSMRILVCGDRNWTDKDKIKQTLALLQPDVVIEGEARGADTIGRKVAEGMGVEVLPFPAQWSRYGRAAGIMRNQQMLDEGKPTLVLAFHSDLPNSKGTKDMVRRARKAGIKTQVIT